MNPAPLIHHAERLYTLSKRASVSNDGDARRDEFIAEFGELCTNLGMIASRMWQTDWTRAQMAVVDLHSSAVHADEGAVGTLVPIGGILALSRSLHSLAAVLGYVLEDAATAANDIEDDEAMAHVEMRAAE